MYTRLPFSGVLTWADTGDCLNTELVDLPPPERLVDLPPEGLVDLPPEGLVDLPPEGIEYSIICMFDCLNIL